MKAQLEYLLLTAESEIMKLTQIRINYYAPVARYFVIAGTDHCLVVANVRERLALTTAW
jgi:hypothetical protein